jgi:hypothetical protein
LKEPTPASIDAAIDRLRTAVASGKLWPQNPEPGYVLMGAATLGRIDAAFAVLDDTADGFSGLSDRFAGDDRRYLFDPATASLRRDTRFWPIAAKLGLVDYWRARDVWPDFCADATLPYDCRAEAHRVAPTHG